MSVENKIKLKPGYIDTVQIVFIILKAFGLISWSWPLVFIPYIIALGIAILCGIIIGIDKLIEKE